MPRLLLVFAFWMAAVCTLQAQSDTWVQTAGGTSRDYVSDILVDANGNSYITGYFTDSIEFDGNRLVSQGGNDVYFAKYDANGNFQWVNHYGWKEDDFSRAITFDDNGDLLMVGDYQDSTIIDNDTIYSLDTLWYGPYAKTFDVYLLTLDPVTGQTKDWFASGWFASEQVNDLEVDAMGRRVFGMTWHTNSYWQYGQPGRGFSDGMIIALDSSATGDSGLNNLKFTLRNHAWGKHFDTGKEMELIGDSLYVLGGTFQDTCYFRDSTVFAVTDFEDNIYLTVHDDTAGWRWYIAGGSAGKDDLTGLDTDPAGNLYLSGIFEGTFEMDGLSAPGSGKLDGFVAQVDHNGNAQWLTAIGGASFDAVEDVKWSSNGEVLVTGYFQGEMVVGNMTLTATDSLDQDMFVASLDATTGQVNWAWSGGGNGIDQAISLEPVGGYIYVLGTFGSTATIGQAQITSTGSDDVVLFRMNDAGEVSAAEAIEQFSEVNVFPNPADNQATIDFELKQSGNVSVDVLSLQGQRMRTIDMGRQSPGWHREAVDLHGIPAGLYFVRLQSGERSLTRKLMIAR